MRTLFFLLLALPLWAQIDSQNVTYPSNPDGVQPISAACATVDDALCNPNFCSAVVVSTPIGPISGNGKIAKLPTPPTVIFVRGWNISGKLKIADVFGVAQAKYPAFVLVDTNWKADQNYYTNKAMDDGRLARCNKWRQAH